MPAMPGLSLAHILVLISLSVVTLASIVAYDVLGILFVEEFEENPLSFWKYISFFP